MNSFSHVPPGFRFHPTDEELVDYYLRKKIASRQIDVDIIKEVDLYKIEPWDLQDLCRVGTEEQSDWIFFSHKDKKYPTGTRTNRATKIGFWKATGRDKAIHSRHGLIGMRKTLVFYMGRAPNGQKSDWIMHEYRLETNENAASQEGGWVVCKVFKKKIASTQRMDDLSCNWCEDMFSLMARELETSPPSPKHFIQTPCITIPPYSSSFNYLQCKQELELQATAVPMCLNPPLPQLESPRVLQTSAHTYNRSITLQSSTHEGRRSLDSLYGRSEQVEGDQAAEWLVPNESFVPPFSNGDLVRYHKEKNPENCTSNCEIDLWR